MKFQITTDYAIRTILFMASKGTHEISTAKEAAAQLGMTYSYFNKVVSKIKQAGFIQSVQGSCGGYRLAKDASEISLYEIVVAMEGDICINRCLQPDGFCSQNVTPACSIRKVLGTLQDQIIDTLKGITITDLC